MSSKRLFYRCGLCGNIVGLIHDGGGELVCCGQPMTLLVANTSDGAAEKHVPAGTRDGNKLKVAVGSVPHPMTEAHYIQWICIAQGNHTQRIALEPNQAPAADFIVDDGPVTIYEYCNLHGLWMSDL